MNHCSKCGCELEDDAVFCPNCGAKNISGGRQETNSTNYNSDNFGQSGVNGSFGGYQGDMGGFGFMQQYQQAPQYGRMEDVFVDPNEKLIASFGGGWLTNLAVLGKIRRINGILTDRRCYVQGNMVEKGKIRQTKFENTVNVEDISGTWFSYEKKIGWLVLGIIFALFFWLILPLILAAYCFWKYYTSKITLFSIEYPGGVVTFKVYASDYGQVKFFAKQIHRVKDYTRAALRNDMTGRIYHNG